MKQQSVGIVLCALLLTTFGHDVLNRHHIANSARLSHYSQGKVSHLTRNKSKPDQHCTIVCPSPNPGFGNLTVALNGSLIVIFNQTEKLSLAVDVKANLVGTFNGTGGGHIFDPKTKIVVEVTGLWKVNPSFSEGLDVLISSGLKGLQAKGQKVSESEAQVVFQKVFLLLSNGEYKVSLKESINLLIEISKSLTDSLKDITQVLKGGIFNVHLTLRKIVKLIKGLSSEITKTDGGVKVLIERNVTLSLEIILTSKSCLEIAGYIWEKVVSADLIHIYGNLNSSIDILKVVAGLGGNSTEGVNGLVTVLLEVVLVIHHKGSVKDLIKALVEYYSSGDHSVAEEWDKAVNNLYNLIVRLKLTDKLKTVYESLVKIRENKWTEEGVNISLIIKALVSSKDGDSLNIIAKVLVLLRTRISIEVAIITLFCHFIEELAVPGGLQSIILVTGIEVNAEYLSISGNVLVHIVKSIKITDILTGNFVKVFKHLDVIGKLFAKIDGSFKAAGASETVEGSFKAKGAFKIVKQLQALIVKTVKGGSVSGGSDGGETGSGSVSGGSNDGSSNSSGNSSGNIEGNVTGESSGSADHGEENQSTTASGVNSGSSGNTSESSSGSGAASESTNESGGGPNSTTGSDGGNGGKGGDSSGSVGSSGNSGNVNGGSGSGAVSESTNESGGGQNSVIGGDGGNGGKGGDSSGSAGSSGNSGDVNGGSGSGNNASASGNAGGNVGQEGGAGGAGGNGGEESKPLEANEGQKSNGKHSHHSKRLHGKHYSHEKHH